MNYMYGREIAQAIALAQWEAKVGKAGHVVDEQRQDLFVPSCWDATIDTRTHRA